jgi:predicted ATPase
MEDEQPWEWRSLSNARSESGILEDLQAADEAPLSDGNVSTMMRMLSDHQAYHFHDTSDTSSMKKSWDINESHRLHVHGGNLAAVLYRIEREDVRQFDLICRHIGRVLPQFDRFVIEESYGKVLLRWKAKWSDKTFGAHLTSDGSLRFFALVTLLNLPPEMLPSVILLDEPELGLHPAAIGLVAQMIKQLSYDRQVIVATQSPLLVDEFGLDEIIVLDLEDGRTNLRKLNTDDYKAWLEQDYTPSQLWQKNVLGGRP